MKISVLALLLLGASPVTVPAQTYTFTTFAGTPGVGGGADTGAVAGSARFYYPQAVALDATGTVYVADTFNLTIRKVTRAGLVTTLAGSPGVAGSADGAGSAARFGSPKGIAVDATGTVFVADEGNQTIRKITPAGLVTTIAGSAGSRGINDGVGTAARFNRPSAVAVGGDGALYVADDLTVRKITAAGVVSTLAGNAADFLTNRDVDGSGSDARFLGVSGVAVDGTGNVYVVEAIANTVRKITPAGAVTTLAGTTAVASLLGGFTVDSRGFANGTGSAARFNSPNGIAVDGAGNVFVADSSNQAIRKIAPGGIVTTLAGFPPFAGSSDSGDPNAPPLFRYPTGVAVDSAGNVYVADNNNHTIRLVTVSGVVATLAASQDAAALGSLAAGNYSVRITGAAPGATGLALAELYERDGPAAAQHLANVSTLAFVGTEANSLICGFVIGGTAPKQLLIRAVGPGLAPFGVSDRLADPHLAVQPVAYGFTVASNDDWAGYFPTAEAARQVGAFPLAPDSKDAALVVRLPPGGYTVVVSGAGNATGTALVEIYDLDP